MGETIAIEVDKAESLTRSQAQSHLWQKCVQAELLLPSLKLCVTLILQNTQKA